MNHNKTSFYRNFLSAHLKVKTTVRIWLIHPERLKILPCLFFCSTEKQ